jgi:hypothetical protein
MEDQEVLKFILSSLQEIEKRQIHNLTEISKINTTLENGLKKRVDNLHDCFEEVCRKFDERLRELESFSWFRDIATDFKNKSLRYGFLLFVFLVLAMGAVQITDVVFRKIMTYFIKLL